jgi:heme-degrading monooxygenase HmoA
MELLKSFKPPYYAVIFTSILKEFTPEYSEMNKKLTFLANKIPGYLGEESVRTDVGITISYWRDLDSIEVWRKNVDHMIAKEKGREKWYEGYTIRIAQVTWENEFKSKVE